MHRGKFLAVVAGITSGQLGSGNKGAYLVIPQVWMHVSTSPTRPSRCCCCCCTLCFAFVHLCFLPGWMSVIGLIRCHQTSLLSSVCHLAPSAFSQFFLSKVAFACFPFSSLSHHICTQTYVKCKPPERRTSRRKNTERVGGGSKENTQHYVETCKGSLKLKSADKKQHPVGRRTSKHCF